MAGYRVSNSHSVRSLLRRDCSSCRQMSNHVHLLTLFQFLMRYYTPGDDIYFFGFSRGAYTARFLAEMLDHVGLLSVSSYRS